MHDRIKKPSSTLQNRMGSAIMAVAAAGFVVGGTGAASASPSDAQSFRRTTVIPMDRYHQESRIVRERSPGKEHVRFSAQPQPISEAAMVVFEIRSEQGETGVVRWRCTASDNVSECFPKPIKVRYLPTDERVVLSVKIKPVAPALQQYAAQ